MNKQPLRCQMRSARRKISPAYRKSVEKSISYKLKLRAYSGLVLSYAAFGTELSLNGLNNHLASENRLVLPRVEGVNLKLYLVKDRCQLTPAKWGIPQPNPALCKRVAPATLQTILLPGLAFDRSGNRLGYGKGFYDRLLKKNPNVETIGVGFFVQLIETIPTDVWDQKVSNLVFS